MIFGAALGLLVLPVVSAGESSIMVYIVGLIPVRLVEWWIIIRLFYDRSMQTKGKDWQYAGIGTAWSFVLAIPALIGFVAPAGYGYVRPFPFFGNSFKEFAMMKLISYSTAVLLFILLNLGSGSTVAAQSANPCDNAGDLPKSFFEVPKGPEGSWSADFVLDSWQEKDTEIPVIVASVVTIQAKPGQRGVRLGCGILKSNSVKPVAAVQLRWIIAKKQSHQLIAGYGYAPELVLLSGNTPSIELKIAKEGIRSTDFAVINFAEIVQPLKEGKSLKGDYMVYIGVNEVRFEDGSQWKAKAL